MGGIQERKKRQLAEREQHFLDQAWEMIQRDGVLKLQMSKLAAECEYAVGTLYLHFSSKEDLLLELAIRSVQDRLALYQQAVSWQAPSRHRMLEKGKKKKKRKEKKRKRNQDEKNKETKKRRKGK